MKSIKLILVFLSAMCINTSQAQQEVTETDISNSIDQDTYDEVKKQLDFTKTKKALRPKKNDPKDKKKKEKEKKEDTLSPFSGFQGLGIFQLLSYILIIGLVAFLIYMIFSNIDIDKKFELSKENITIDEIEDIQDLDTDSLLEKALAIGDYRTAVRIKFLAVLKDLSKREKINWKREKTNRDYSRELLSESYGLEFNELTYIFDFVWYGKQKLVKSHYDVIDGQFNSFSKVMNG